MLFVFPALLFLSVFLASLTTRGLLISLALLDVSGLAGIISIVHTWKIFGIVASIGIGAMIGTCGVLAIAIIVGITPSFQTTKVIIASPVVTPTCGYNIFS